ncbi:unnamed protein product [Mytilus edulis]|uniref:Uncharacterized protein n=1 Tax=Mytilus edulis TaxID=6550 RepID=A0A8S3S245_MYTED|nr:unnamed protein product [Mytilus edulis]
MATSSLKGVHREVVLFVPFETVSGIPPIDKKGLQQTKRCQKGFVGTIIKMDFVASKVVNLPIVVEDVKAITPLSDVPNVLPRQNSNPNQHPSPTPETSNNVTHLSHTRKSVVTPICSKTLKILLMGYPNQDANYLVSGFEEGFRLGYDGCQIIYNQLINSQML